MQASESNLRHKTGTVMKKIGIVGGVAWLSTIKYYRTLCQLSERHHRGQAYKGSPPMPEFSIESVNMNRSFALRGVPGNESSWGDFDAYFNAALRRLEASGADFAVIASNTPHNRFEAITRGIGIPVLSIFEAVAAECKRLGVSKMLILGTEPTMNSPAFPNVLKSHGVLAAPPESSDDRNLTIQLISQLQSGHIGESAAGIHAIGSRAFASEPTTKKVVCLACTELPLAFPAFADSPSFVAGDTLYINTTIVHAQAAFAYALG